MCFFVALTKFLKPFLALSVFFVALRFRVRRFKPIYSREAGSYSFDGLKRTKREMCHFCRSSRWERPEPCPLRRNKRTSNIIWGAKRAREENGLVATPKSTIGAVSSHTEGRYVFLNTLVSWDAVFELLFLRAYGSFHKSSKTLATLYIYIFIYLLSSW